jgi:hypothetical protein
VKLTYYLGDSALAHVLRQYPPMVSCNNYLIQYEVVNFKEVTEAPLNNLVRVDLQEKIVFIEAYD